MLVPALGPVIYEYSYRDALRDGVIVPFTLRNVVFHLEPDRQEEYDKLTKAIARTIGRLGPDAPEAVALLLRRARVLNLSLNRVRLALRIISGAPGPAHPRVPRGHRGDGLEHPRAAREWGERGRVSLQARRA